jgi:hypothetical protein
VGVLDYENGLNQSNIVFVYHLLTKKKETCDVQKDRIQDRIITNLYS